MQNNALYVYKKTINDDEMNKYTINMHKNGRYVCTFKPCRDGCEARKTLKTSNINGLCS
jgi:hypothetical protein